ncbi:DUF559 domain-containing protein [Pseudonocardia sp. HH130630-07]|uniref:DUF559 domain-containing protein n=1 Tax=Pseudonocardia sp. HH130630-07 TaxID=1690815 RepID=UPI000814B540|nr:DUF559 domain-containing protein [Pseudonocardia sp. HH130630-07]ANY08951.1 hypothetical protein AFB00_24810 [Pseudonocardia sp. HH130630-07]
MRFEDLLAAQDGVISRAQAIACGIPVRTVARHASDGRWTVLARGVYLVAGHRPTEAGRVRAAWLSAGPRATVHGPAAAFWHGMLDWVPTPVAVTVPRTCRVRSRAGVRIRRRDLYPADRTERAGVAVTGVHLTVLETTAVSVSGAEFLDRALQRHVRFEDLLAALHRNAGAHGMRRAGDLLVAAADRADSAAERRLFRLLRDAGLDGFVPGYRVGPWLLDVAFPAARVAVEVDGWAWHTDAERFRADRRKQNALVAGGWTVLRFTWPDLTDRPDDTVRRIRRAIDQRR